MAIHPQIFNKLKSNVGNKHQTPSWVGSDEKKSSHLVDVLREFGKIEVQAFFEIRKGQPERAG